MNLFFETAGQSICFLAAVPVGLALAFLLDGCRSEGVIRAILDVVSLISAGIALLTLTVFLQDEKLRLYHVLGMLVGCILYMGGVGRMRYAIRKRTRLAVERFQTFHQEKKERQQESRTDKKK